METSRFTPAGIWLDTTQDPALVEPAVVDWLRLNADQQDAQLVYRTWLSANGNRSVVEAPIRSWLGLHGHQDFAQPLYIAWLHATKDCSVIETPLRAWLGQHGDLEDARFVYCAWLDAQGDWRFVADHFAAWLQRHPDHQEADFPVCSWIKAGGPFKVVRDTAFRWLHAHAEHERAGYMTKFIAKLLRELPVETMDDVLRWCAAHPAHDDAVWRLGQLSRKIHVPELADRAIDTVTAVLDCLMRRPFLGTAATIGTWVISNVMTHPRVRAGYRNDAIAALYAKWLRHPHTFSSMTAVPEGLQHWIFARWLGEVLETKRLSVAGDRIALENFAGWVDRWDAGHKRETLPVLKALAASFPAPGVWERVRVSGAVSA